MRRRDFILTVAGAALWSRTAKGQQASPVVGVLAIKNWNTAGERLFGFTKLEAIEIRLRADEPHL
jgi:hypothetical protein